jgi:hypothetical protein
VETDRSGNATASSCPVEVDVGALFVLLISILRLDPKGMGTEVIALGLQQIGRAVSGTVTIVEAQGGAKSGHRDATERALGDDVSSASLCPVKSVSKEVIEEQVVEFGVFSERFSEIFQPNG